jgi:SHS2 domain-containing protein
MSHNGYQEIDHTADLALKVWGKDFETLLRQAASGMYDLMGVVVNEGAQIQNVFSLDKDSDETILVDFLNELVYLAEDRGYCYSEFDFNAEGNAWTVRCRGQRIENIKRSIKAVTFHDLEINQTKQGLKTIITFDV